MTICVVCRKNMFQGLYCQICKIRFHQRCGDQVNNLIEYRQCDPLRMCKSEKALVEHMLSANMERYHIGRSGSSVTPTSCSASSSGRPGPNGRMVPKVSSAVGSPSSSHLTCPPSLSHLSSAFPSVGQSLRPCRRCLRRASHQAIRTTSPPSRPSVSESAPPLRRTSAST